MTKYFRVKTETSVFAWAYTESKQAILLPYQARALKIGEQMERDGIIFIRISEEEYAVSKL